MIALLLLATFSFAAEPKVEFTDKVALIKGTKVSFEKHAAAYDIEKRLLPVVVSAKKTKQKVSITALADSLKIIDPQES